MNKFYVTTAIPYPNGNPHVGFGLEIVQADVLARYHRALGNDVWFLTGVDEHGLKVYRSAQMEGISFQKYVDRNSAEFAKLKEILNISYDDFIRTSDRTRHWPGAQKLWRACAEDIYAKEYEGLYCVGCEAFVNKKDLIDGECPEHHSRPEKVKEKNYFFKLTKYKKKISELIKSGELKIVPENRGHEILNLLNDAEDFSVSRPIEKISWGIPVPDDTTQVQYVWFDALANYITAVGYGRDEENFKKWWPADTHVIGKGILRFHAIYWPAMLLSAGLSLPKSIYIHGYVSIDGEKISKSLGNVVSPKDAISKYGIDPVRYYLLREIPTTEDGDFSYKKLEDRYNGDLANNLGNLISRVAKLIETKLEGELNFDDKFFDKEVGAKIEKTRKDYHKAIEEFKLHEALTRIWDLFTFANAYIDEKKPWADLADHPEHFLKTITSLVAVIINGAKLSEPFLPETSQKIGNAFGFNLSTSQVDKLAGQKFIVTKTEPLFPRLK
ncbi:MAG: methionine--tRNA ligase [Candidatus Yanofskybacteria bacterium]|nr:methionine--tRNA ligase [Candidatus Yanofskybacteria bacterium]